MRAQVRLCALRWAARAALLAGLSSAQDEDNGWNARIAPTVSVVEVRPTSMAFSIAPNREYAVMAPETLSRRP